MDNRNLYEHLRVMCNQGSVTPGQATSIRQVSERAQRFEEALEAIERGDINPIRIAKRALGRPEPGDPETT